MKIFLDTIGCRLNQAEIESIARKFLAAGHEVVPRASQADLTIINTCTVTDAAASDSRAAIRRARKSGNKPIFVTGCWATLNLDSFGSFPEVTKVIPNDEKDLISPDLLSIQTVRSVVGDMGRIPIPGVHHRTRAFIKAQDGCNYACTYCITTIARGKSHSRSINAVIDDIQFAIKGGVKEIVLTGVHLGSWGADFTPKSSLTFLIGEILRVCQMDRLRLSSIEPWDLDDAFFQLWKDPRLCRHLHLPLQSGSATVLARMARKTTPGKYERLVTTAREMIPGVAITTDIIAGFPGETDKEFNETVDFVSKMGFSGGHVFKYSPRPGTLAAVMKPQISADEKKSRSKILRDILAEAELTYQKVFWGSTLKVLWEKSTLQQNGSWQVEGYSDNNIRIRAVSSISRWNEIDYVAIETSTGKIMIGKLVE